MSWWRSYFKLLSNRRLATHLYMGSALAPLPASQATVISSSSLPYTPPAHFFMALLNIACWARRSSEIQYRNKGRELTFIECSLSIGCSGSLVNILLITGSAVTLQQWSGFEAQLYHILWPWPSDLTLVTTRFLFCKMEILQGCWMKHQTLTTANSCYHWRQLKSSLL